jgi:hypothetical protein
LVNKPSGGEWALLSIYARHSGLFSDKIVFIPVWKGQKMNEKKSSNTTKKWLVGCGIGCGAILLIAIVLGITGFMFFKNIANEFKDTEEIMNVLTERYGKIPDYSPNPDGSISADRLEAFLEVREAFSESRKELEASMQALQDRTTGAEVEVRKPRNIFQMVKLGFGLVPQIAEFMKGRNQALLDAEMGMGEYYYIYVIAYFSWLGNLPEDGPDFQINESGEESSRWGELDREQVREERRDLLLRRLHRMTLPMLHNQLEKLTSGEVSGVEEEWKTALEAEIQAMEEDRFRLPWEDGLPAQTEACLEPFRYRLEQSYNAMINPLEFTWEQR